MILVPDHLLDWKNRMVYYDPEATDDDSDVVLWFNTDDGQIIPCAALSELMVITGREKSGKSLLQQSIIMSNWTKDKNKSLSYTMKLKERPILYFDTEQPVRTTRKNVRRFHEVIGVTSQIPSYHVFNIRAMTSSQKLEYVTYVIKNCQDQFGQNPGLIVIDQIADLCPNRDVNNDLGVETIHVNLCKWQEITDGQCLTSVIIHTNRGGINTNGKLGVMLDQKTDCTFHLEMDYEEFVTTLTHKSRGKCIPNFRFRHDRDGHPRLLSMDSLPNYYKQ